MMKDLLPQMFGRDPLTVAMAHSLAAARTPAGMLGQPEDGAAGTAN